MESNICNLIGVTNGKVFKELSLKRHMKFETRLPRRYGGKLLSLPVFDEHGQITQRAKDSLENVLYLHSHLAKIHAKSSDNNPANFRVEQVYIVGSCARTNRINSDVDYLLIFKHLWLYTFNIIIINN